MTILFDWSETFFIIRDEIETKGALNRLKEHLLKSLFLLFVNNYYES